MNRATRAGEFIRVQCLLAGLPFEDDRRWALETRETLLRRQYAKGWAGPIRHLAKDWRFRRGFVEHITIRADRFLEHAAEFFQLAPINSVRLLQPENQLSAIAASPWLERLNSLDFSHTPLDPRIFEDLAYSPALIHLKDLNLRGTELCTEQGVRMLADCEYLRNLTLLDLSCPPSCPSFLSFHGLYVRGITALAESPYFKKLTSLHLSGCGRAGGEIIAALADSRLLTQLTALDISHNANYIGEPSLSDAPALALDVFFQSSRVRNLRHLTLLRNHTSTSIAAFAESPHLQNLRSLRIDDAWLGGPGCSFRSILVDSPNLRNLICLNLFGCMIDDVNARGLFESEQLKIVQELNLNETGIGDEALSALADADVLQNLRCLKLQGADGPYKARITAKGVKALAESEHCQNLVILDLGNQPVDEGIRDLAKSDNLKQLRSLGLWKTGLSDADVPLLCDAGALANLELLDVRSNKLSADSKSRLRERFGAGVRYGP